MSPVSPVVNGVVTEVIVRAEFDSDQVKVPPASTLAKVPLPGEKTLQVLTLELREAAGNVIVATVPVTGTPAVTILTVPDTPLQRYADEVSHAAVPPVPAPVALTAMVADPTPNRLFALKFPAVAAPFTVKLDV